MNTKTLATQFNQLPYVLKLILVIMGSSIMSCLYRVFKYLETKQIVTLLAAIAIFVIPCVAPVLWVLDIVTMITKGEITVLAA